MSCMQKSIGVLPSPAALGEVSAIYRNVDFGGRQAESFSAAGNTGEQHSWMTITEKTSQGISLQTSGVHWCRQQEW